MSRTSFVLFLCSALALVGCGKKAEDDSSGGSGSPSGGSSASMAVTDWVVVDDVAVRIQKARVQKPTVEERPAITSSVWKERDLDTLELVLSVQVENRSKVKKLDYLGWGWPSSNRYGAAAVDEHGNKYQMRDHQTHTMRLKGRAKTGAVNPGDAAVTDLLCFEQPVSAATELSLTLPALTPSSKEAYTFKIPASAWK